MKCLVHIGFAALSWELEEEWTQLLTLTGQTASKKKWECEPSNSTLCKRNTPPASN